MTPLELSAVALRDALSALPDSVEKTIGLRSIRHCLTLISRDIISASDAYYRAARFYQQAQNKVRKAS